MLEKWKNVRQYYFNADKIFLKGYKYTFTFNLIWKIFSWHLQTFLNVKLDFRCTDIESNNKLQDNDFYCFIMKAH